MAVRRTREPLIDGANIRLSRIVSGDLVDLLKPRTKGSKRDQEGPPEKRRVFVKVDGKRQDSELKRSLLLVMGRLFVQSEAT
jgi:hypothetical protein